MIVSEPLALSSLPASPWKNGKGSTRTLAVEPPDASLDDFAWRISLAEVNEPGDFSSFPGIDRTLLLWSGNGLLLRSTENAFTVEHPFLPAHFSGEETIFCDLISGPTVDLNIMARRNVVRAHVQVAHAAVSVHHPVDAMFIVCAAGAVQVVADGHASVTLLPDHFARIDHCHPGTTFAPILQDTTFLIISFRNRIACE